MREASEAACRAVASRSTWLKASGTTGETGQSAVALPSLRPLPMGTPNAGPTPLDRRERPAEAGRTSGAAEFDRSEEAAAAAVRGASNSSADGAWVSTPSAMPTPPAVLPTPAIARTGVEPDEGRLGRTRLADSGRTRRALGGAPWPPELGLLPRGAPCSAYGSPPPLLCESPPCESAALVCELERGGVGWCAVVARAVTTGAAASEVS